MVFIYPYSDVFLSTIYYQYLKIRPLMDGNEPLKKLKNKLRNTLKSDH